MVEIRSKAYGLMTVGDDALFTFPFGLPGFEELTLWALFKAKEDPFYILQSREKVETAFFLIDPLYFRPDYQASPPENDLTLLKLADLDKANSKVFVIINIPGSDALLMTANLQAPLIFNTHEYIAGQCISTNPTWQIRHTIADEMNKVTPC